MGGIKYGAELNSVIVEMYTVSCRDGIILFVGYYTCRVLYCMVYIILVEPVLLYHMYYHSMLVWTEGKLKMAEHLSPAAIEVGSLAHRRFLTNLSLSLAHTLSGMSG